MSSVEKVTEIIVSSRKSFDDAVKRGVERADKTLSNIRRAWIQNQRVKVGDNGEISEYCINLKVSFVINNN